MSVITRTPARPDPEGVSSTLPPRRGTAERRAVRRLGFRPDVEGLRALAVLLVVLYHAHVPGFGGGFVGVDVFFVISGFLICGLMYQEIALTGRLHIVEFFARRARRILPAAALVIALSAVVSWLVFTPLRTVEFLKHVVGSIFYSANWTFIAERTDYLHQGDQQSPLLHFWSLAVEEQFYLVWPFVFVVCGFVGTRVLTRRYGPDLPTGQRAWAPGFLIVTMVATVVSFAYCVWQTHENQPFAYMATPTRMWQFGAGALVAVLVRTWSGPRRGRWLLALAGWAGLAAIGVSTAMFSDSTLYPGWSALAPTLAVMAILAAGSWSGRLAGPDALLRWRPLQHIGAWSYSWYLWHWPVIVFTGALVPGASWPVLFAAAGLSLVPAILAYRFFEDPLRRSTAVRRSPSAGLSLGLSAMVVPLIAFLLIGTAVVNVVGKPSQDVPVAGRISLVASQADPFAVTESMMTPSLVDAASDTPHYPASCIVEARVVASPHCVIAADQSSTTRATANRVVLLGDSHAGQWYPVVQGIASTLGADTEVLNKVGCPLAQLTIVNAQLGREYRECDDWRNATLDRLAREPAPRLVFISSLSRYSTNPTEIDEAWKPTIASLSKLGVPIIYLADTPFPDTDIPSCLSGHLDDPSACDLNRVSALGTDYFAAAIAAGKFAGVKTVDVTDVLCPSTGDVCPATINNTVIYRDESHVTNTAMAKLGPLVFAKLKDMQVLR